MDWIKKNIWQTLLVAFITVVFSTLGSIYVYQHSKTDMKIDSAASIEYVDRKTGETKIYIDIQDTDLRNKIIRLEDGMDKKADKYHVESIEKKIDVIYEWVINNSKK